MTFHNATNGLMLNNAPAHTIKKNTTVNTCQNLLISITLICVKIQTNLAQTKHKATTLSSTKLRSTKLSVVVKKCVDKKVCLGREKAGRVATPQSPYNRWMSHTIILNRVVIYY